MKKSLSVLVATAMVSSIFASVAFAADELTTQEKLDALIAAGIFDKDGTGNGSELDANMSREQLAKILAKLKNLKEVTGTSYTDVASDRWSAGFIQAVSKATPPLMDGVADGVFDPAGDVTLEQLATVAVRALGLQVPSNPSVEGDVSDWAEGYVAAAIANGLLGEKDDYTVPAIRSELVEASYAASEVLAENEKPAKASVKSVKAVGVSKVEVTLDRDVDTTKATFTVSKGGLDIALDTAATKWSEDKKTATLTLKDAKLTAGEYQVTLGGLAAEEIATASAKFTAEDETVKKIEFSTASDTIAQSTRARVQFRAVNQYNENASLNAGDFTVNTPGFSSSVTKDNMGAFVISIDTTKVNGNASQPGLTIIPVYVYENGSRLSVTQQFKLGTEPFVTKMELGSPVYPTGKTSLSAIGEFVTIPVNLLDQYGNPVAYDSSSSMNVNVITTPYTQVFSNTPEYGDFNNDNFGEIKLPLLKRAEQSEDYTVTIQIGGANATTKVSVKSAKLATKIGFGTPTDTFSEGDMKDVYIPILAYDEEGNALSADDIVDDQNLPRINITASNVLGANGAQVSNNNKSIDTVGDHKGQIHITSVEGTNNQYVYMSMSLNTTTTANNSYVTMNYPIQRPRVPDKITIVTKNAPKTAGGGTDVKFNVLDQNGKVLNRVGQVSESNGQTVTYRVYGETKGTGGLTLTTKGRNGINPVAGIGVNQNFNIPGTNIDVANQTWSFVASGGAIGDNIELTLVLQKSYDGTNWTQVSTPVTTKLTYIDPTKTDLTYSVSVPTTLYAALDENSVLPDTLQDISATSDFKKSITVAAKDATGDTVVLPTDKRVIAVSSSVYDVVSTSYSASAGTGYIMGNKPGKATITVMYREYEKSGQPAGSGTLVTKTFDTEVKAEAPVVQSVTYDANVEVPVADVSNALYNNAYRYMNLAIKDQYGSSFATTEIEQLRNITNVYYTIEGNTSAVIDNATGAFTTLPAAGDTFTLRAYTANGKVASTFVRIR